MTSRLRVGYDAGHWHTLEPGDTVSVKKKDDKEAAFGAALDALRETVERDAKDEVFDAAYRGAHYKAATASLIAAVRELTVAMECMARAGK